MKKVTVYTDGACHGNPGPGGWGAILIYGKTRREIAGSCLATTNNRMELTAAIEALRALKEPCEVNLHTDSMYLRQGMTEWLPNWRARGWRRSGKARKLVKNVDLWKALDGETSRHTTHWHWVKGHDFHPENERCDHLAGQAIETLRGKHDDGTLSQALSTFQAEQEQSGNSARCAIFGCAHQPPFGTVTKG